MKLDDYELQSIAFAAPSLSWEYLTQPWGGHFMPSGFALAQILAKAVPFSYIPMAFFMSLGLGAAALCLTVLALYLLGDRWAVLLPLAVLVASGATWDSVTWWVAALNSVPLLIAIPLATYLHLRWLREGEFRSAVLAWLTVTLAATFFEKAVGLVFFLGLITFALRNRRSTPEQPGRTQFLVFLYVLTLIAIGFGYLLSATASVARLPSVAAFMDIVGLGFITFFPLLFGGPWVWTDTAGAATPLWLAVVAANVVLGFSFWQVLRFRGASVLWLGLYFYLLAMVAVIALGRAGWGTQVIAQPRYFADAVMYAILIAMISATCLAPRAKSPPPLPVPSRAVHVTSAFLVVQGVLASLLITLPHLSASLLANSSRKFVVGAIEALSTTSRPLNNGLLPGDVMWPLVAPANQIRPFFAPIFGVERFPDSLGSLSVLNPLGQVRPGEVVDPSFSRDTEPCPIVLDSSHTTAELPESLPDYWHTLTFAYLSDGATRIEVRLGESAAVPVELSPGLNQTFAFLGGAGDQLHIERIDDGVNVCISDIAMGFTAEATP